MGRTREEIRSDATEEGNILMQELTLVDIHNRTECQLKLPRVWLFLLEIARRA